MSEKIDDKKVEFMSREEALWKKNKDFSESQIKDSEDKIMINKAFVNMFEKELQKLRRSGKGNGNS